MHSTAATTSGYRITFPVLEGHGANFRWARLVRVKGAISIHSSTQTCEIWTAISVIDFVVSNCCIVAIARSSFCDQKSAFRVSVFIRTCAYVNVEFFVSESKRGVNSYNPNQFDHCWLRAGENSSLLFCVAMMMSRPSRIV